MQAELNQSDPIAAVLTRDYMLAYLCQTVLDAEGWITDLYVETVPGSNMSYDLWMIDLDGGFGQRTLEACMPRHRLKSQNVLGVISSCDPKVRWNLIKDGYMDYLIKPFSPIDLVKKIGMLSRRRQGHIHRIGQRVFDSNAYQLQRDDGVVMRLTPAEANLLGCLVNANGRVCRQSRLQEELRHSAASLRVLIRRLRIALEPEPSAPQHLITVDGGYLLIL